MAVPATPTVSGGPETFGRILTGRDVERACMDRLREWSYVYLAEMERQTDREPNALPQLRGFIYVNDFEKWPEDQLPCLLLLSTGLGEEPLKDGRTQWRARWNVGLAVICSAASADGTTELARVYVAAMRALLLQHPPEGCRGIWWTDETYEDIPQIDGRSIAAGQAIFSVEYGEAVTNYTGPPFPPFPEPPDPTDPDPPPVPEYEEVIVQHVQSDVQRVPTTEGVND